MRFDFGLMLDFLSPLALLAILCLCHDLFRHRGIGTFLVSLVAGLAFGLVAALQMTAAMVPVPGLLVHLGAVPVALAGAYLGWRGLVACLLVALAVRGQIGGIGLVPDATGLLIAGGAGLIWAGITRGHALRRMRTLMGLAFLMSLNVVAGAMLPAPFAGWMLTSAAPMLVLFNLVAVPLLAAILEGRGVCVRAAGLGCNDRAARSYRPPERPYGAAR